MTPKTKETKAQIPQRFAVFGFSTLQQINKINPTIGNKKLNIASPILPSSD